VTDPAVEYLYLTTTGRRSGQPREIEIWFTERAGRYYVISEHGEEAHWVQNLRAGRRVTVRVAGRAFTAAARVVDPAAERDLALAIQELSERKYGWGQGLVVELLPDSAPDGGSRAPTAPGGGPLASTDPTV
jgi:deazaflavin-dependent oxidoreductase (nitroreductase family)